MSDKRKPCAQCPFSRRTEPGLTGGTCPTVYVGQSIGPFWLPCHMDPKYKANRLDTDALQCAGAAIFRANIGVTELLPEQLLRLEADTQRVFANFEELIAHHMRIPLPMARMVLMITPPMMLLEQQLERQTNKTLDSTQFRQG